MQNQLLQRQHSSVAGPSMRNLVVPTITIDESFCLDEASNDSELPQKARSKSESCLMDTESCLVDTESCLVESVNSLSIPTSRGEIVERERSKSEGCLANNCNTTPLVTCCLCKSSEQDELALGECKTMEDVTVHYHCLVSFEISEMTLKYYFFFFFR